MMEFLRTWVKDIFIIVVGLYFIEIVLPEGSMRKYIKFILSIMILGVVISPLTQIGNLGEVLAVDGEIGNGDQAIAGYGPPDAGKISGDGTDSMESELAEVQWIQMEAIYREKLEEQTLAILGEAVPEAEILGIYVELEERGDENAFGKVRKIVIKTVGDEYVNSIENRVSQGIGIDREKVLVEWEEREEAEPEALTDGEREKLPEKAGKDEKRG